MEENKNGGCGCCLPMLLIMFTLSLGILGMACILKTDDSAATENITQFIAILETEGIPATLKELLLEIPLPEGSTAAKYYRNLYEYLCCMVHAESRGEPLEGQIAVAAVILNRCKGDITGRIFGIISARNKKGTPQFSPMGTDDCIYVGPSSKRVLATFEDVSDKTKEAVDRALAGEDPTEKLLRKEAERLGLDADKYAGEGALYFYNPKGCSKKALENRSKIKVKVAIDNHVFYYYWDTE